MAPISFRQMKPRRSTLPSRYSSDDDVQVELSSHSGSQFKPLSQHQSPRLDHHNNDNIVYAEIHHQPRVGFIRVQIIKEKLSINCKY